MYLLPELESLLILNYSQYVPDVVHSNSLEAPTRRKPQD